MMKKVNLVLIGAGDRGTTYADLGAESCPEMEIVAVADPDPVRRNYIKDKFQLSDDACFEYGEDLLKLPKMADAAIIAVFLIQTAHAGVVHVRLLLFPCLRISRDFTAMSQPFRQLCLQ